MDVLPPPDRPVLVQWVVDTRALWPEAVQTKQLAAVAPHALRALLTDDERKGVLRYFHVRDAKMALASHLLKHLVVARCACVPWRETRLTRDANNKPVYYQPGIGSSSSTVRPVAFNVTHQDGLVVLAAVYGADRTTGSDPDVGGIFDIGVDIVSPAERRERDHKMVAEEDTKPGGSSASSGWAAFVDMHADVFAPGEAEYLKHQVLTAVPSGAVMPRGEEQADLLLDRKLRGFYTLWCLREAYVKMTGEALLAPWLKDLEFRNFRPPPRPLLPSALSPPASDAQPSADLYQDPSATVTTFDIHFHRQRVSDANLCLRALGDNYMVCTAVRSPSNKAAALGMPIGPIEVLSLEDIISFALASDTRT